MKTKILFTICIMIATRTTSAQTIPVSKISDFWIVLNICHYEPNYELDDSWELSNDELQSFGINMVDPDKDSLLYNGPCRDKTYDPVLPVTGRKPDHPQKWCVFLRVKERYVVSADSLYYLALLYDQGHESGNSFLSLWRKHAKDSISLMGISRRSFHYSIGACAITDYANLTSDINFRNRVLVVIRTSSGENTSRTYDIVYWDEMKLIRVFHIESKFDPLAKKYRYFECVIDKNDTLKPLPLLLSKERNLVKGVETFTVLDKITLDNLYW